MSTSSPPIPPDDFAVRVWREGVALRVAIAGELDLATGPTLIAAVVQRELASNGDAAVPPGSEVIVDLAGLTFIDIAGLRALLQIRSTHPVRVVNSPRAARRLFALTDLADVLDIM